VCVCVCVGAKDLEGFLWNITDEISITTTDFISNIPKKIT